eukprot:jgi/Orpsp1_1/1176702/evm.model.c7180000058652.1
MNSGRYKEEFWNNIKSQIEEDRITLQSTLSNSKDEIFLITKNINYHNITTFNPGFNINSNTNTKNPFLEEMLQNEFEILNSQVKEINGDDNSSDNEDIDATLNRLYSNMNSNLNSNINSLNNSAIVNTNNDVIASANNSNSTPVIKNNNNNIKLPTHWIDKNNTNNNFNNNDNKENKNVVNHQHNDSILRNDSIKNEKKYNFNYKVISPHSKEVLDNKDNHQKMDVNETDSYSSNLSQIINSYSDNDIKINNVDKNNNETTNNIKLNNKKNNIQLEHILSPICQFYEIKDNSNDFKIVNYDKNEFISELSNFDKSENLRIPKSPIKGAEISSFSNASSNISISHKFYKKYNGDNLNNLRFQSNIAGNNKFTVSALHNVKDIKVNRVNNGNNNNNSNDNNISNKFLMNKRNNINNNNKIGNIVNPTDEIYNMTLQSKNNEQSNNETNKNLKNQYLQVPPRRSSIKNSGVIKFKTKNSNKPIQHKIASINMKIPEETTNDSYSQNRSFTVVGQNLIIPSCNKRYSLNNDKDNSNDLNAYNYNSIKPSNSFHSS